MKIRFVSTYPPTKCGIAYHAKHLADSLEKIGVKPEIIRIENPDSENPFYFLDLAKKAMKDTTKEDIIHFQLHVNIFGKLFKVIPGFYFIFMLIYLKIFSKVKIVVALHDVPKKSDVEKLGIKGKILFQYHSFIYIFLRNFTDMLVTHSEYGREINLKEWGIKKDRATTLLLGLPTSIKKMDQKKCKKRLGYSDKKIIVILGYIRSFKNYDMVLESLKKLDKNVILLFVGEVQLEKDKEAYENIVRKTNELGLGDRVKLLGFVKDEELPIILNAADLGINLHIQGGGDFMSSTMAMQLAYETPMLATAIPSFESLEKKEKCIETFKEGDILELTKKIAGILGSPSRIKSLKEHSKKYWNKSNWDEIGRRTKKMYLSLTR